MKKFEISISETNELEPNHVLVTVTNTTKGESTVVERIIYKKMIDAMEKSFNNFVKKIDKELGKENK